MAFLGYNNNTTNNSTAVNRLRLLEQRGEVSHAYILESEDMAKCADFANFAAALVLCNASGKSSEKPCGVCPSCQKAIQGAHPDIITLSSSGGKSSFHIDSIRRLRSDAFATANEGIGKVFILEDAQDMTAQAQNALLKLLEEPPAGVKLFLLVRRREMLLPTVISRCQIISLKSDTSNVVIPPESIDALSRLLAPDATRFDFFTYFINLRPKRDAALILLNGMRFLAGELLVSRKTVKSLPEGAEKLPQLATDRAFAVIIDELEKAVAVVEGNANINVVRLDSQYIEKLSRLASDRAFIAIIDELEKAVAVVEGNANINALFTSLAYALWSAKNL